MRPRTLVAMAEVASVPRSIEFYRELGFEVGNSFTPADEPEPTWAWLSSDGGAELMIARRERRTPTAPPVLFYLYCDDVAAARAELESAGVGCGAIAYPFYAPRGEFQVRDPDGYQIMVTHT